MITWIKNNMIKIFGILVIIQFIASVYLILLGMNVNISTTSHSQAISNSYASSGSLAIGYIGGVGQGEWEIKKVEFEFVKDVEPFLKSLNPIQFCFCKIVADERFNDKYYVFYPEIVDKKSKKTEEDDEIVVKDFQKGKLIK